MNTQQALNAGDDAPARAARRYPDQADAMTETPATAVDHDEAARAHAEQLLSGDDSEVRNILYAVLAEAEQDVEQCPACDAVNDICPHHRGAGMGYAAAMRHVGQLLTPPRQRPRRPRNVHCPGGPAMKYRKKIEIDAIQWDGTWQGHADVNDWAWELMETGQAKRSPKHPHDAAFEGGRTVLYVYTLDGRMHVAPGDWIVCAQGEFHAVKSDVFAATYEPVEVPR